MTRRGWTLHEMLISLGVMSGIIGLAAHAAAAQLRFFSESGELAGVRRQVEHASAVAASVLWSVSSTGGDIIIAQDSAIEVQMPIATSFVCGSSPGVITIAAGAGSGNTLASFADAPGAGDRLLVLYDDSLGSTWLTLRPTAAPSAGAGCAHFPEVAEARVVPVLESISAPPGAPVRFSRRARLSLYRGSDKLWYLGTREWNAESNDFNTVQPVAGPLNPYSQKPEETGLRFVYRDGEGAELPQPADVNRIASITVVARRTAARFADSMAVTVSLPNAR